MLGLRPARACRCDRPATAIEALAQHSDVLVGTVVSVNGQLARVRVGRRFKGTVRSAVVTIDRGDPAMCGVDLKARQVWLLYASRIDGGLHVSNCSRSALLSLAIEDIKAFTGARSQNGSSSSTSHGDPAWRRRVARAEAAREKFDRAIKRKAKVLEAGFELATALVSLGGRDDSEALELLSALVLIAPKRFIPLLRRSTALKRLQKTPQVERMIARQGLEPETYRRFVQALSAGNGRPYAMTAQPSKSVGGEQDDPIQSLDTDGDRRPDLAVGLTSIAERFGYERVVAARTDGGVTFMAVRTHRDEDAVDGVQLVALGPRLVMQVSVAAVSHASHILLVFYRWDKKLRQLGNRRYLLPGPFNTTDLLFLTAADLSGNSDLEVIVTRAHQQQSKRLDVLRCTTNSLQRLPSPIAVKPNALRLGRKSRLATATAAELAVHMRPDDVAARRALIMALASSTRKRSGGATSWFTRDRALLFHLSVYLNRARRTDAAALLAKPAVRGWIRRRRLRRSDLIDPEPQFGLVVRRLGASDPGK